jgi:hypothetical protein
MGGLLCWARRSAILLFDKVPTDPHQLNEFDAQMRELVAAPGVTESLLSDESGSMKQLCAVLAKVKDGKSVWTLQDREWLLDLVEKLYE